MQITRFANPRPVALGAFLVECPSHVPELQRNYSWSTKEAGELWADFEDHLRSDTPFYYLGNIIYYHTEAKDRMIVDGQQRLATATLLLCAIRDAIQAGIRAGVLSEGMDVRVRGKETELDDPLSQVKDAIKRRNKKDDFLVRLKRSDSERLRWIQRPHESRIGKRPMARGQPKMYRVYDWFLRRTQALADPVGIDQLCSFANLVLKEAVITATEVADLTTAYTVFSNINNRGKDLTLADIVRVEVQHRWQVLEGQPSEELVKRLEKLEAIDYDELGPFMRRYWIVRTGKKTSAAETNKEIVGYIRNARDTSTLLGLVDEMIMLFEAYVRYRDIEDGNAKTRLERRLAIFALSGFAQHIPAVMAVLAREEDEAEAETLVRTIESSYVCLNVLMGRPPADVELMFAKLAHIVHQNGVQEGLAYLVEAFGDLMEETHRDDTWFQDAFGKTDLSPGSAHFVLRTIEKARRPDEEVQFHRPKELHLEHILPQNPDKDDWPKKWRDEDTRDEVLWLPGNLALLGQRLNSEAANRGFTHKKTTYRKSLVSTTRDLERFERWDDKAIKERSLTLAAEAAAIWGWDATIGGPRPGRAKVQLVPRNARQAAGRITLE